MGKHNSTEDHMDMAGHTCTVTTGARGEKCGEPAITGWTNPAGERFYECYRHALPVNGGSLWEKGRPVEVRRHGKTYTATVTRVTPHGNVYATVRYDNGVEREVRV